jgi:acyl-CoA dehydrogenase
MAVIREHLAAKGLGLHNDLQNETRSSATSRHRADAGANYGTDGAEGRVDRGHHLAAASIAFGLTEPKPRQRRHAHGDHRRARRRRLGHQRREAWNTGMHVPRMT